MINGLGLSNLIINHPYLEGLEKLNIFIGKNDSGKSTILKEVSNLNENKLGLKMDIRHIKLQFEYEIDKYKEKIMEKKCEGFRI